MSRVAKGAERKRGSLRKPKEIIRYTYEERRAVEFWIVVDEGEEPSEETIIGFGREQIPMEDTEDDVIKGMRKRVEDVSKTPGMTIFQVEDGKQWEIFDLREIIEESREIREKRKRIADFEDRQMRLL